nr:protein chromatin remodeling 24 [Quercus suber]
MTCGTVEEMIYRKQKYKGGLFKTATEHKEQIQYFSQLERTKKNGVALLPRFQAIPAASRFETNQIGGRVRGPSPLIHQWIEFCLQAARALPFKQEVIPGASPSALESAPVKMPAEFTKGKQRLDTNLIAGIPPPEILASALKFEDQRLHDVSPIQAWNKLFDTADTI